MNDGLFTSNFSLKSRFQRETPEREREREGGGQVRWCWNFSQNSRQYNEQILHHTETYSIDDSDAASSRVQFDVASD